MLGLGVDCPRFAAKFEVNNVHRRVSDKRLHLIEFSENFLVHVGVSRGSAEFKFLGVSGKDGLASYLLSAGFDLD